MDAPRVCGVLIVGIERYVVSHVVITVNAAVFKCIHCLTFVMVKGISGSHVGLTSHICW